MRGACGTVDVVGEEEDCVQISFPWRRGVRAEGGIAKCIIVVRREPAKLIKQVYQLPYRFLFSLYIALSHKHTELYTRKCSYTQAN